MFPSSLWKKRGVSDVPGSQTGAALGPKFPLGVSLSVPASPPLAYTGPHSSCGRCSASPSPSELPLAGALRIASHQSASSFSLPRLLLVATAQGGFWGLYKSLQSINCFFQLGEPVCKTSGPDFSPRPRSWEGNKGTALIWERSSRLFQRWWRKERREDGDAGLGCGGPWSWRCLWYVVAHTLPAGPKLVGPWW